MVKWLHKITAENPLWSDIDKAAVSHLSGYESALAFSLTCTRLWDNPPCPPPHPTPPLLKGICQSAMLNAAELKTNNYIHMVPGKHCSKTLVWCGHWIRNFIFVLSPFNKRDVSLKQWICSSTLQSKWFIRWLCLREQHLKLKQWLNSVDWKDNTLKLSITASKHPIPHLHTIKTQCHTQFWTHDARTDNKERGTSCG